MATDLYHEITEFYVAADGTRHATSIQGPRRRTPQSGARLLDLTQAECAAIWRRLGAPAHGTYGVLCRGWERELALDVLTVARHLRMAERTAGQQLIKLELVGLARRTPTQEWEACHRSVADVLADVEPAQ